MNWEAVGLSIRLASLTTLILLLLGLPLSYWLSVSRWRFKILIEAVIALPLVLPPTVLGFYILSAMGPQSHLGKFYERLTGNLLPFSFEGLLVASVLSSLPFAVQPFFSAFSSLDRQLIEASWCLGVSRKATFFRLILPLCLPGIVTGLILSFAHTLGEFGVVLMIGGNIQGVTRTISVSIFDDLQAMNYDAAEKTSALLLMISFLILVITVFLKKRTIQVWQPSS